MPLSLSEISLLHPVPDLYPADPKPLYFFFLGTGETLALYE